jgi:hypothetical protein
MKTIAVEIRGTSPLLIHRFSETSEQGKPTRLIKCKNADPRQEAEQHAYKAPDGTYYFSAFAIPGTIGGAGANHKTTGSRKSLRWIVPSAIRMTTDTVTILNGDGPATYFEVDSRPVNIPSTKGRIMRHRPRFDTWGARFELLVNDNLLSLDIVHQLLTEAGQSIGIGDFRPSCRGPFGCFRVTSFQEL